MLLDLAKFYRASNPNNTLMLETNAEERYQIDLSSVRGRTVLQELKATIAASPDRPTCQLFVAPLGCDRAWELRHLKVELEREGFYIVNCEVDRYLDLADVDVSDILLSIAYQVSASLETIGLHFSAPSLRQLLSDFWQGSLEGVEEMALSLVLKNVTTLLKEDFDLRHRFRRCFEPRTNTLLLAINEDLIDPGMEALQGQGKSSIVTLVEGLDRVQNLQKLSGSIQQQYLFLDRGKQFKKLHCHTVYSIPIELVYSEDLEVLINRFEGKPKVLPMVPVRHRDGTDCEEGLALLRQVVLVRGFPDASPQERLNLVVELFDSPETLDRMCRVSGGHVRNLLQLLYSCLQREDPPLSRCCLEAVIQDRCRQMSLAISKEEWELLRQVACTKTIHSISKYQMLLRGLWVFQYQDDRGYWFDVNPILAETKELMMGSPWVTCCTTM